MEKKTIGAFISALRRAHGMTQQELGDRLFVSDKTVSRWERDESTPDLSLIPIIADLFGVTADELLRGERRAPSLTVAPPPYVSSESEDGTVAPPSSPLPDARGERQFRLLLERRGTKYKNFSLISVAVALVGLMLAAIVNLGFLRGYIALGLCVIFSLGALITQLCFANAFYLYADEEEGDHSARADRTRLHNRRVTTTVVRVCFLILGIVAFCLPLGFVGDAHFGMEFGAWLLTGGACTIVFLLIASLAWILVIRPLMVRRGLLNDSEQENAYHLAHRRLVRRITAIGLSGGIIWGVILGVLLSIPSTELVKPEVFDNYDDFTAFMAQKDPSADVVFTLSGHIVHVDVPVEVTPDHGIVIFDDMEDMEIEKEKAEELEKYYTVPLHNSKGEKLFTYLNRREGYVLEVSDADDALPIRVWPRITARADVVRGIIAGVGIFVLIIYLLTLLILYRTRVSRLKAK